MSNEVTGGRPNLGGTSGGKATATGKTTNKNKNKETNICQNSGSIKTKSQSTRKHAGRRATTHNKGARRTDSGRSRGVSQQLKRRGETSREAAGKAFI